jgi:hypothetical protein
MRSPDGLDNGAYLGRADVEPDETSPSGADDSSSDSPTPPAVELSVVAAGRLARNVGLARAVRTDGSLLAPEAAASLQVTAGLCLASVPPNLDVREMGTQPEADGETAGHKAVEEPAPAPQSSDLLTDFLPFNRVSLEDAIDRFLGQFEVLNGELTDWSSPTGLLPAAAVVATAALAAEVVRRRSRSAEAGAEDGEEDFARFAGFPHAWSLGES